MSPVCSPALRMRARRRQAKEWLHNKQALELEAARSEQKLKLEAAKQKHDEAMATQRQNEKIRTAYLERLKAPGEHLRTLRFVLATTDDPKLRHWASSEEKIVNATIAADRKKERALRLERDTARKRYLGALEKTRGELARRKAELKDAEDRLQRNLAHSINIANVPVSSTPALVVPLAGSGGPIPG